MALLALTPTAQPKTGATAPLNLTALLAANILGANTGVSFTNSGREVLYVNVAAGGSTILVQIGGTIEGQPVTQITLTPTASTIAIVGPFQSDENQPGGTINVNFGTSANVTSVALVQNAGTS